MPVSRRNAILILGALTLAAAGCRERKAAPPFYLGGIQVNEADHTVWTKALRHHGLDTVAATVYAKQGDWDKAHLWWEADEPAVTSEIRTAKAQGLQVVLILRVALDHAFPKNRYLWHGMIHPRTPKALEDWFDQYERFVLKWAAQAQRMGVDVLGVGSELSSLTSTERLEALPPLVAYYLDDEAQARMRRQLAPFEAQIEPRHWAALGGREHPDLDGFMTARSAVWKGWAQTVVGPSPNPQARLTAMNARRAQIERRWRRLIRKTRAVFSGRLTYAANFDQYQEVGFWDALDLIGINAYFQLRDSRQPPGAQRRLREELEAGWRVVLGDVARFRSAHKLEAPVLFTELGYTQARDGAYEPWAMTGLSVLGPADDPRLFIWQDQPKAPEERALAVSALNRVVRSDYPSMFAGLLYWKLSTLPGHRAEEPFVLILEDQSLDPLLDALKEHRRAAEPAR